MISVSITRKALLKWTFITCLCGAYSFVNGFVVTNSAMGAIIAMILGMLTLIIMLSFIDSHPTYQSVRGRNAQLAHAINWGVKIRCFWALLMPAVFIISFLPFDVRPYFSWVAPFFEYMFIAEIYIGWAAFSLTKFISGIDFVNLAQGESFQIANSQYHPRTLELGFLDYVGVYMTTVATGLLHTVILAVLCAFIYLGFRVFGRKMPTESTTGQ